ncbi:MAG: ribosome hibernation-promoting factor, HPF/YfiA family [Spirochaetia bacterium]
MKWHATGVDYHVSDHTNEYLEEKFHRLEHMSSILDNVKITIVKEPHGYKTEAHTHFAWHSPVVHVEQHDKELWPAIDHLFDKLEIKLSKEKEKHQDHRPKCLPKSEC